MDFNPEEYQFNESEESDSSCEIENGDNTESKNNKRTANDDIPHEAKKTKTDLYKQPTAEELTQLKETENLFNSNIFRLQIHELLGELKPKAKYEAFSMTWFEEFKKSLKSIPDYAEQNISEWKQVKKPKNHFQKFVNCSFKKEKVPCTAQNITMKFLKPVNIEMQGLLKNISTSDIKYTMDIIVTMSKNMFLEKDYLNNRYFLKKSYYMAYIESYLSELESIASISEKDYLFNKHLKYWEIIPSNNQQIRVNVFIVPEVGTFQLKRFQPTKNNIKELELEEFEDFSISDHNDKGTYLYNALLLFDCTLEHNLRTQEEVLNCDNIKDGIKLLLTWLHHRQLNQIYYTFTSDLLIHMIHYLFAKKKINKFMSSYQVVRIFWTFISELKDDQKLSIAEDVKQDHLQQYPGFALLDSSGIYNVASLLQENILKKVKSEAKLALNTLDSNKFNAFSHLFTTSMPSVTQYDLIVKIFDLHKFRKIYEECTEEDKFNCFGFYNLLIRNYIEKVLKYGLTNRIVELIPIYHKDDNCIIYGVNLDENNCYNVIEKGPRQYEKGAEEFKTFWGKLADLRRFKDSSIYEAVYFENVKTIQDKRHIVPEIIKFVMNEKLELNFQLNGIELEKYLKLDHIKYPFACGSSEDATLRIKAAQTALDKILRNLNIPLPITGLQWMSDIYAYADVFPPVPTSHNWKRLKCIERGDFIVMDEEPQEFLKLPHLVEPIECVFQLATNSKWPKTLEALRAMKTVYYFELSKLLRNDHAVLSSVHDEYVDVFYTGYVFRLRLFLPKEVSLMKKDFTEDGVVFYRDTESSLELESNLEVLPKVNGALNGLHQEHPSFGPSTCLIKRWLRSQMLDADHISDVVINLLNASLFITTAPYRAPVLPHVAFVRFLKFIAEFDPEFHTVCANFNNTNTVEELSDIDGNFLRARHNYNALHIITPFDNFKSVFTKHSPSKLVLRRLKCLASATYKSFLKVTEDGSEFNYMDYFVPNLTGYDVLIHLTASVNVRKYQQVNRDQKLILQLEEYDDSQCKSIPVVGFEPIELYLKELRANYGQYALFFHDFYGGNVIGVLWKPNVSDEMEFKVSSTHGCRAIGDKLKIDKKTLTENFYIHGKGIVWSIDIQ